MNPLVMHNAVGALVSAYTEALGEQTTKLNEVERLNAKLARQLAVQPSAMLMFHLLGWRERQKSVGASSPEDEQLVKAIDDFKQREQQELANVAPAVGGARGGPLRAADVGRGDGAAGAAADRDAVRAVRGEVEDVVRDGPGPPSHRGVRDGAPAPRPAGAGAAGEES